MSAVGAQYPGSIQMSMQVSGLAVKHQASAQYGSRDTSQRKRNSQNFSCYSFLVFLLLFSEDEHFHEHRPAECLTLLSVPCKAYCAFLNSGNPAGPADMELEPSSASCGEYWTDIDALDHEDPMACTEYVHDIVCHLLEAEVCLRRNGILATHMMLTSTRYKVCSATTCHLSTAGDCYICLLCHSSL